MPIIAQSNGWTISSDLGERDIVGGKQAPMSFWIEQDIPRSETVFVEVTPLSGHVADLRADAWISSVEPAQRASLSKALLLGADERFSLQLSARDFHHLNEVFEIKVYSDSAEASWGDLPLVESVFSMLGTGSGADLPEDHFEFGVIVEREFQIDFPSALSKLLMNDPVPLTAQNSVAKPNSAGAERGSDALSAYHGTTLGEVTRDDFIFG